MKNKYIYILVPIIILIVSSLFYTISYLNNNFFKTENILTNDITSYAENIDEGIKIYEDKDKLIDSDMLEINSTIYESLDEFLNYLNTGSGINLNVDLINEDFYINNYTDTGFIITKFDKKLISDIDNSTNKTIKNQAILDIYNSYKTDKYILGESNNERTGVRLLGENELPSNMQFHNNILLPYKGESSLEAINRLQTKENKTVEDNQQLSYLYDFSGDYKKSLNLKEDTAIDKITYKIEGRVFSLGKILVGAKIELLNYDNISTYTNENGKYILEFETYPLTRLRLRATYDNLSDGYNGVYVVFDYDNQSSEEINFSLHVLDTKELITSKDLAGGKVKIVKSTIGNTFKFKDGVLLDNKGKIYSGDFNVEIFEFNRNTPGMENFLTLDNFDDVYGYTGNMMITNGMTYLLITDLEGNELFISKQNPIITQQYVDLDYLLNNKQNGTNILTEYQLDLILNKSKEDGYPIDNQFLSDRKITGFSPWWVLNRTKGIWENNGIKLLNKSGLKESFYYNVD